MPWVALNLLTVMTWPSKSGNGALRGTFGLVLPTFLAVLMYGADTCKESRKINDSTEWSLSMIVYSRLAQLWGPFQVDLFASRLNFKVPVYVSWRPDPGAMFTNALFMSWGPYYFYAFPLSA